MRLILDHNFLNKSAKFILALFDAMYNVVFNPKNQMSNLDSMQICNQNRIQNFRVQFLPIIKKGQMLKKAHVINIGFQNAKKSLQIRRSFEQMQGESNSMQINLQTYMNSKQSTSQTYQLLRIIKGHPKSFKETLNSLNLHTDSPPLFKKQTTHMETQQMQQISPKNNLINQDKKSNKSIDFQISRTGSQSFGKKASFDDVKESHVRKSTQKYPTKQNYFNFYEEQTQINFKDEIQPKEHYGYWIEQKYRNTLITILSNFLNFKICSSPNKDNLPKTPNFVKRPRTTCKNFIRNQSSKQNNLSIDKKPFTAQCNNRKQNVNGKQNAESNLQCPAQDFKGHLQKNMQMQKYLEKQTKKIGLLQNQLTMCYKSIKQKNIQIKDLQLRQNTLKKKFKYEIDRIIKGKALNDINEIYLSNLHDKSLHGNSIFEINGKKYIKSEEINIFAQAAFLTAPKSNLALNQTNLANKNLLNFQNFQNQESILLKKSPSMQIKAKNSKPGSSKLQQMKLQRWLETLKKQMVKFKAQKETMLDRLAENNGKIQKYIEKIQIAINIRKCQMQRCLQQISRCKDAAV